jgi:hypothetical protein
MARVDVINGDRDRHIEVTLSRRNLLALLHKLDTPGSKRTIINGDSWEDGTPTPWPGKPGASALPPTLLVLRCEDDMEHYALRPQAPGEMHATTETYVRTHGGRTRHMADETPGDGSPPEKHGWRPRPDPALVNPDTPGLRAHRHPPNRLHAWVFTQQDLWVDYWGNELELKSMSAEYVQNVLAFTRGQAARIREIVDPDLALDQLAALVAGAASDPDIVRDASTAYDLDAIAWVEQTPLVRALKKLVDDAEAAATDDGASP